jgi:hypothetical protein
MIVFLVLAVYLIIILCAVSEKKKMIKSFWSALGFVVILALRSPFCGLDVTGTSTMIMANSYGGVFLNMPNYSFSEIIHAPKFVGGHMEVGWLFLTKFISLFTNNLQVYLAIISILQLIPVFYVIGKYSSNVVLSYFIFACLGFYVHYFSGIRQMLAVSLILLAFDQIFQKRYFWFALIVLIASSIHSSALIFFIIWPLSRLHLSLISTIICIIGMIIIMPLYHSIVSTALELLFESRYETHLESEGGAITMFIVYSIFLLSSFVIRGDSPEMKFYRAIVLAGVGGQSLGVMGDSVVTRIGFYFNVFFVLLLPEIVRFIKDKNLRGIMTITAIILLCIFFILTTNSENSSGVIPYSFFWERPVSY